MRKLMEVLRFRIVVLTTALALPAAVQAQFTYTTNNDAITITGYTGPGGAVTIPDTINGLPVTSIGTNAIQSCASLTSVTVPDSVTNIGAGAFYWCLSLASVSIGNGVTSIGGGAFDDCVLLTNVAIPDTVTSIGDGAFSFLPRLDQRHDRQGRPQHRGRSV